MRIVQATCSHAVHANSRSLLFDKVTFVTAAFVMTRVDVCPGDVANGLLGMIIIIIEYVSPCAPQPRLR